MYLTGVICARKLVRRLIIYFSIMSMLMSFGPWFSLFRVEWVMPQSIVDVLACWKGSFGHHGTGAVWSAVPLYLCGCFEWTNQSSRATSHILLFNNKSYEKLKIASSYFDTPSLGMEIIMTNTTDKDLQFFIYNSYHNLEPFVSTV